MTDEINPSKAVSGYRDLSQATIDQVNLVKQCEGDIASIWRSHMDGAGNFDPPLDKRWMSIAKTHLEQAFMAWNRAIMQPEDRFQ